MALRILLIEDSATYRDLVTILLEDDGHTIVAARTGSEGIRLAGTESLDLVLTDMHLPDMDGFQIIREIRQNSPSRAIRIIGLTSEEVDSASEQEKGRAAGFEAYVQKPIDREAFREIVGRAAKKV